jgi:hypothetical protein
MFLETVNDVLPVRRFRQVQIKNVLAFVGGIFLILICLWAAAFGYAAYIRSIFNPSSRNYVDETIPVILTSMSQDELIKRCSPELIAMSTKGQLDHMYQTLAKLGPFQTYNGAKGEVEVSLNLKKGIIIYAPYIATATFRNGSAEIEIKLIRHNNVWQIFGFHLHAYPLPFMEQGDEMVQPS